MSETCWVCGGDGILEGVTCSHCGGDGVYIKHSPANVIPSHRLLEEIDDTEYVSLTDAQKNGLLLLLSCGYVDLNEGRVGRTRFWAWFGTESTTVANLTALIS